METEYSILARQPKATSLLGGSAASGRVAHAYLFEGVKGAGKEALARFFTQLLLCPESAGGKPCGVCRNCRRIREDNHPNVTQIRPDGQDIKKGQISDLIYKLNKTGIEDGRKIYILHQADRMNIAAANTLLKFLEEPEGEVTALLLTDRLSAILPTIRSRCQEIHLQPPPREAVLEQLVAEGGVTRSMASTVTMINADPDGALALASDEQFGQARKTVIKLVEASDKSIQEALLFIQTDWGPLFKEKDETELGLDLLLFAYRDISAVKAGLSTSLAYPDNRARWEEMALRLTFGRLASILEAILKAKRNLQSNMNRTLLMEQLVLNMQEGQHAL
ncbi:DNA polymerase III subunit delta' [Bhargavaea ginsengi]|uniref:DNA polymerase III subunit delta' n=1 Tax=Bhargavaea ginsengi TaxID=426757 RepID=UPI002041E9A4|nr:DNA polymerase III subunit delta' [Bhargavaea ginsengi]MCM3088910.1 DNA polymerase III subunit delta' [Bhargavaea ginsengi]